jgi:pimeloyl-ACP methyl ester carboxylesterase
MNLLVPVRTQPYVASTAVVVAALALSALVNRKLAKKAERENPPTGKFVEVDGVRLHYFERGDGEPLVLLHGIDSAIQDFQCSGLIEMAAKKYRVIVFDRPGFGYSERPRGVIWSPEKQADLIHRALGQIGVSRAIVLGHSWGASVAVAFALKHPSAVASLVLVSGYYYATARADVVAASGALVPILGDIMSYTLLPVMKRLMWPLAMFKIFGPERVPKKFEKFPKEMTFRPSQIRASAAETALMIPGAFTIPGAYTDLRMPVVIIAGEKDRMMGYDQSARLHHDVEQSTLHPVAGAGHMIHQTATYLIMDAIDEAAAAKGLRPVEVAPHVAAC